MGNKKVTVPKQKITELKQSVDQLESKVEKLENQIKHRATDKKVNSLKQKLKGKIGNKADEDHHHTSKDITEDVSDEFIG